MSSDSHLTNKIPNQSKSLFWSRPNGGSKSKEGDPISQWSCDHGISTTSAYKEALKQCKSVKVKSSYSAFLKIPSFQITVKITNFSKHDVSIYPSNSEKVAITACHQNRYQLHLSWKRACHSEEGCERTDIDRKRERV